ncbi:MAG: metallophosphoesterase [Deltaproteobacteria bacterium]|nr:metallophosphoesterase [Deltaproteobacteria bacterium]
MKRLYLVLSDLHLSDVEDHADGWKAHKASRYLPDEDLAALLGDFEGRDDAAADKVLILNGDVFDFDLVTAVPGEEEDAGLHVSRSERRTGLDPSDAKSVWKLERMLGCHPVFLGALARLLLAGVKLVYVLGNHDREFHFGAVRRAFTEALQARAREAGGQLGDDCVRFEPWFFAEPGEIYVEHGQQYDHYSAFRYLLEPTCVRRGVEQIALPMGNLSNRHLMNRMGTFNPHASDYILNLSRYFTHWLKHYAFRRRSLLFSWLWGSLVVMSRLLGIRRRLLRRKVDLEPAFADLARRYEIGADALRRLHALQRPPITSRFFRVMREFWIDRVLIFLVLTGGTIALALVPIPLWIKLMVPLSSFPLLLFIYETLVKGESIFSIEQRLPRIARRIAALLPVQVVCFGHTHVPRLIPLDRELVFADTGTWAPIFTRRGKLQPGLRNYLRVSVDGRVETHLGAW